MEDSRGFAGPFITPSAVSSPEDFATAARRIMGYLQNRLGFDLWMVTRTVGDDWIILDALDRGYNVEAGDVLAWSESFCRRMVGGEGPRIAPRSDDIPAYRAAEIGRRIPIAAYIGMPIHRPDGSLFGTLCALDPAPQPDAVTAELPLVQLLADLLASILIHELQALGQIRTAERAALAAEADPLTQLANRGAWQRHLEAEEVRCRRYGHPAGVMIVDLDEMKAVNDSGGHHAGDELLTAAARVLRAASRPTDLVARIGGDEFGILAAECDPATTQALAHRIQRALADSHISASLGFAARDPAVGLAAAWKQADLAMYEAKRRRYGLPRLTVVPSTP
jgi:diguanylate cyclase (GGDEF)-like protein